MSKRQLPEINAGSMADIAFLLLIFFLVTTTMNSDSGILRKIPEKNIQTDKIIIKDKNFLEININSKNELFIGDKIVKLDDLKEIAINFIDNGVGLDKNNKPCDWCNGKKDLKSSDHPTKAFISINPNRETNYETYISVLDNINIAYAILRDNLAQKLYKTNYSSLIKLEQTDKSKQEKTQQKIKTIREKYPILVSDL